MHPHLIAAACHAGSCTGGWQYATESWTRGGVILGLAILVLAVGVAVRVARALS